jgi:hypothetical protein
MWKEVTSITLPHPERRFPHEPDVRWFRTALLNKFMRAHALIFPAESLSANRAGVMSRVEEALLDSG